MYSMVLDLNSISKDEITNFFGWNIYNTEANINEIRRNDNEYRIIEKIKQSEYLEKINEEIKVELSKYK